MGLDVSVGYLSLMHAEEDDELLAGIRDDFAALNRRLQAEGLQVHQEPESLSVGQTYEDRVGGYGSLHHLRRMAAWLALRQRLPPPQGYQDNVTDDPWLQAFYAAHDPTRDTSQDAAPPHRSGWLARLLNRGPKPPPPQPSLPPYQHLMLHSDCEGYYLPQDFERVIVDPADPDGRLQMIGSAPRLLNECLSLAEAIGLPPDTDPDAEDEVELTPELATAEPWRAYPIEAYVLSRLIQACRASVATGAAVVFC